MSTSTIQLGGNRIGSGGKVVSTFSNYERSTKDLGKVVQYTFTTGTVVPIYVMPTLTGDIWDIDLETRILTEPAVGPVFGLWKYQIDVFKADRRLYSKQLHQSIQGIGLEMETVKVPLLELYANNPDVGIGGMNQQQVSSSSLLCHCGTRGFGKLAEPNGQGSWTYYCDGTAILMYYEIIYQYYANKQEGIGYVITGEGVAEQGRIDNVTISYGNGDLTIAIEAGGMAIGDPDPQGFYRYNVNSGGNLIIDGVGLDYTNLEMAISGASSGTWIPTDITNLPFTRIEQYQGRITLIGARTTIQLISFGSEPGVGTNRLIRFKEQKITQIGENLTLAKFDLKNITNTRAALFSQPESSAFTIGYKDGNIRGLPYDTVTGRAIIGEGNNEIARCNSYFKMAGLCVKTYQSDRFNNWLSKEWVERQNKQSNIAIQNGAFTFNQLLTARRVFDLNNRIISMGGTYQDWEEAVYGVKVRGAAEMPVYIGGMSEMITFDEVVSSSEASTASGITQPLGTLGGRGTTTNKKGGKITAKIEEQGLIMICASATPILTYSQGNKWFTHIRTIDDLHKPIFDGVGYQELMTDEMAAWDMIYDPQTQKYIRKSAGMQTAYIEYETDTNEAFGNFADINNQMWMTLNRRYQPDENGNIEDLTTYIDPTKFNYPFAYVGLDGMPFWGQIGIHIYARRLMRAKTQPSLM